MPKVIRTDENSPARRRGIRPGDVLVRINGHKIRDVIDYRYYSADSRLLLEIRGASGELRFVRVRKPEGADLGLTFESYLMDRPAACVNKCVFCFVDQLPRGMRGTLYFKDDDVRLSFLQGNYVTLTNLSREQVQRILDMRLAPLNISVHSTDPQVRSALLGNKNSAGGLWALERFARAGLPMNCQIVCCPGLNDGAHLQKTLEDLAAMHPAVRSVSVVPVGLTRHRQGLPLLRPFDRQLARETVRQVERFGAACLKKHGTRLAWAADELYLKAGLDVPENGFYEDYPQLENGVGMLRLFITEAEKALKRPLRADGEPFSIATGFAAQDCLQKILESLRGKYAKIKGTIYPIRNDFFGETIDVAGLLTGGDLIAQLRGKKLGARLLIARNMLRSGEDIFLDDRTLEDVSRELGVPIRVVEQDGADLVRAMTGS